MKLSFLILALKKFLFLKNIRKSMIVYYVVVSGVLYSWNMNRMKKIKIQIQLKFQSLHQYKCHT